MSFNSWSLWFYKLLSYPPQPPDCQAIFNYLFGRIHCFFLYFLPNFSESTMSWCGLFHHCILHASVQFSSVTQSCPNLCDPMNCSTPGLPVHNQLPEFTQTHVHRVSDAIQSSHPLSSPSFPAPNPSQHQSLFQWANSSHLLSVYFVSRVLSNSSVNLSVLGFHCRLDWQIQGRANDFSFANHVLLLSYP